ncbi:MAG: polysaccharide deacetylase family protein [Gammaproteobacteria bacterium]|nr:polysaccharide deacetylase family protein [Gammaproteobacteria bacterium]
MKNFRRSLKTTVANALHRLSLDTLIGHSIGTANTPLIICYHRVVQDFDEAATRAMPSLLVSTSMFEKQLDWLLRHFDLVSLDEILQNQKINSRKTRRQATITFDDGYADFYWNALPILQRKGIPSSVFVVTNLVGTTRLQTHDELYLLLSHWYMHPVRCENNSEKSLEVQLMTALDLHSDSFAAARYLLEVFSQDQVSNMLSLLRTHVDVPSQSLKEFASLDWPMLRDMVEKDVTIGSHTLSHALLPHHDQQRVADELLGSRLKLEAELGVPAGFLAYPDGQFNNRIAREAEAAGYAGALTICTHTSSQHPRHTMPRTVLWENACIDSNGEFSPAIMGCLVNGVFNLSSSCTQDHTVS